jgi:exodeoxyribonuclease VII large subunit
MNPDLFSTTDHQPLTITELTGRIKETLELKFSSVTVVGEISNFKIHTPSRHAYFSLKDEGANISAVMWRSNIASVYFSPQDGMKVIARGRITVYPPRGNYQIDVHELIPAGLGELQLAFEKLKQKLKDEGFFDPSHKKPIPDFPRRIGIVTSETGTAFRDIVSIIRRRYPPVELILAPVRVQGSGAAVEIATAIEYLNRYGEVDVMIIGRGGGSLEDLWAFNEEVVARAIFKSAIPVISAVGHEVDISIADFVADLRAPTPSAAAELVVPEKRELLEIIHDFAYNLSQAVYKIIYDYRETIQNSIKTYSFNRPYDLLRGQSQRVDDLDRRLKSAMVHRYAITENTARSISLRLSALNPERVLDRGYAIIYHDDRIIQSQEEALDFRKGSIRFRDGRVPFIVEHE